MRGDYPSNLAIAQKGAGEVGKCTNSTLQQLPSPAQPTVLAQAATSSRSLVPPLASTYPAQCAVFQCLPLPRRTACTTPAFSSMYLTTSVILSCQPPCSPHCWAPHKGNGFIGSRPLLPMQLRASSTGPEPRASLTMHP